MKNIYKILLSIVLAFVAWAVGYFGTKMVLPERSADSEPAAMQAVSSVVQPSEPVSVAEAATAVINNQDKPAITETPIDTVAIQKVRKVEKREFETVMNSGNIQETVTRDFKNRISRDIQFSFSNLRSDDPKPLSYSVIIENINMDHWESVSVLTVSYSESDRLKYVQMSVNYPEE